MRYYIIMRFKNMIITFIGVILVMYFAYLLLPGNYTDTMIGMPLKDRQAIEHRLHLDESKTMQFKYWLTGMFKGDFGISFVYGEPVQNVVWPKFKNTFLLFFTSLMIALFIAIPISIISAVNPHSKTDNFWTIFAFMGISIPPFVFGSILIKVFTFNQFVFHLSIFQKISFTNYVNLMTKVIFPFLLLTFINLATFLRYLRSSMLEIIGQEYVKTARAKGLTERKVLYKHCLKNALIPVLTVFGNSLPSMISTILMIEFVFDMPGLGTVMIDSVHARDYPLAIAFTMILAIAILIMNFLVDIAYRFIDPRVKING